MAASLSSVSGPRILAAVKKQLLVIPCATYYHRQKVKRQKPMPRRVYDIVTSPIYPDAPIREDMKYSCQDIANKNKQKAKDEENPYETFMIGQLKKEVEASKMIIICHQMPCPPYRHQLLKMHLRLEGIKLSLLSNKHMNMIIEGTHLANLKPLLDWTNVRMTCPEQKIKILVKTLKKFPEFQILGGFVEDRLVSKHDIISISQMPDIEQQYGELASLLNHLGGANTLSMLNHHQQRLTSNLQQYHSPSGES